MNVEELRDMLSEQMKLLSKKEADPKNVNAMVNAAGKIINSVRLEMEYAKMIGAKPAIPFVIKAAKPKTLTR